MDGVEADEIETQFRDLKVVKTFRKDRTRKLGAAFFPEIRVLYPCGRLGSPKYLPTVCLHRWSKMKALLATEWLEPNPAVRDSASQIASPPYRSRA